MILNSMRLNNLQTANNLLFQKRHKNRAKGHLNSQKPDVFVKSNDNKNEYYYGKNDIVFYNFKVLQMSEVEKNIEEDDKIISALMRYNFENFIAKLVATGEFIGIDESVKVNKDANPNILVGLYSHDSSQDLILKKEYSAVEFINLIKVIRDKNILRFPDNADTYNKCISYFQDSFADVIN